MRAQRPRRFGTTASRRPPDASTRHTSRSNAAGSLVISSACTSITRSIAESASGFLPKQAEVRRGVTDAEHALARGVTPQRADPTADEAAGNNPQPLAVEIAKIHNIDRHATKLSRNGVAKR